MDIRTLTPGLSVAPQIAPGDLAAVAAMGYRAVICNRPDGEADDQPAFRDVADAARAAGLEARHIPVVAGAIEDADADAFAAALSELPGPVLAYCRSGARSAALWSRASAGDQDLR